MESKQKKKKGLRREIRERTVGYIVAAFGLIAGLAWNDAVKSLIESIYPTAANGLFAKFFYAFAVTIIAVFFTIQLTRLISNHEDEE